MKNFILRIRRYPMTWYIAGVIDTLLVIGVVFWIW